MGANKNGIRSRKAAFFSDKLSCMSRPVRIEFEGALYHVKSKRDEKLYDYNSRPDPFVRRALAVVWGCTNEQLRL